MSDTVMDDRPVCWYCRLPGMSEDLEPKVFRHSEDAFALQKDDPQWMVEPLYRRTRITP